MSETLFMHHQLIASLRDYFGGSPGVAAAAVFVVFREPPC